MTAAALLPRPRARLLIGAALLAIVWAAPARSQSIVINEFQAINASTLTDEDGDHTDWIELKNPGSAAVSITGWHLSDNKSQLTKWTLPSTTINPGQFIIIFASGKDRATTGKQLHTNFKLGGDGEFLGLIQPDGKTIASGFDPYPQQLTDHSYGRSSAAGNPPAYFSTPTPGKQNSVGFKGLVSDTEISSIRGLKE
ncbi:MAG: lamin tail domain-containing protein, partial [Planctomycetota bacterium]|nr:lamin tail domain-containing protein [Planctomycetota bacterium]